MNEKFVVPMEIFTNEIPSYWLNFLGNLTPFIEDWREESKYKGRSHCLHRNR